MIKLYSAVNLSHNCHPQIMYRILSFQRFNEKRVKNYKFLYNGNCKKAEVRARILKFKGLGWTKEDLLKVR